MAKLPGQEPLITEYLMYRLAQANRAINRQLKSRLAKEGVLVEQWWILKVLSDGNGRSMSDLAEVVLLNHPTLTKIIDRMVSDALVYRASDPRDRRKVLMFCSDRGRILCHRLDLLAMSQEAHIVQSCGSRSVNELKQLLKNLIDRTP
jgi:MarR family transcriptional regulator, organic hydroperoxide resistance regulator